MRDVQCPVCAGGCRETRAKVENSFSAERTFFHCQQCNHLFLFPLPTEQSLSEHYSKVQGYFTTGYLDAYKKNKLKRIKSIMSKYHKEPFHRILEIGPGPIGVLPILPNHTFYSAVEASVPYSEHLKRIAKGKNIEARIFNNEKDLFAQEMTPFDIIIAIAVLEHLVDPGNLLINIGQLLKNDGILIIGVPDRIIELPLRHALYSELGGMNNAMRDFCATHIHSFSRCSIETLIEQIGHSIIGWEHTLPRKYVSACQEYADIYIQPLFDNSIHSKKWLIRFLMCSLRFHFWKIVEKPHSGDDRCEMISVSKRR